MPRRRGNRKLTDAQVIGVREKYRELRQTVSPSTPYGWTDAAVARQYEVSKATVRNIVMGLTRQKVGGPIDTARVEANMVHHHPDPHEPSVEVVIAVPGRETVRLVYPAGTTVTTAEVSHRRGFLSDTP